MREMYGYGRQFKKKETQQLAEHQIFKLPSQAINLQFMDSV